MDLCVCFSIDPLDLETKDVGSGQRWFLQFPILKKMIKTQKRLKSQYTISVYNSRKQMNPEFGQQKQNTLPVQVYWTETHTY